MGGWGALGRGGVTGGRAGVVGGEAADLIIIMLMRTMMLMKMVVLMPKMLNGDGAGVVGE